MYIFTNVNTILGGIKTIDGGNNTISDSLFVNLLKKWYAPIAMGIITAGSPGQWKQLYERGLTFSQNAFVGGKPFMFTVESGHLIAYTLDYEIATTARTSNSAFQIVVNSDVNNDGDNKIKRLDGGEIEDSGAGTSWTVTDEGNVFDVDGDEVLTEPPMSADLPNFNPSLPPCPMILLRRKSS